MNLSIFVFAVGEHVGGLDFTRVEHIEEQRAPERPSRGADAERGIRMGDEIFPCADLRTWFGVTGPAPGARLLVRDASRRVFLVDRAFEVVVRDASDVFPLPPYLFGEGARPFRGMFPYRERWGLLLHPDAFFHAEQKEAVHVDRV